jgi:hypothetical protein
MCTRLGALLPEPVGHSGCCSSCVGLAAVVVTALVLDGRMAASIDRTADRPDAPHRIPKRAAHKREVEVLVEDAAEGQPIPPTHSRQAAGEDAVERCTSLGCVVLLSKVA